MLLAMRPEEARWREMPAPLDLQLRRLQTLWSAWRDQAPLPPTSRFDPESVATLMPWIILVDILPQPNAFRIYDLRSRFMGSSFCQFFGVDDQQHLLVSEIGSPFAERWFDVVDAVLQTGACRSFEGSPFQTAYPFAHFEMCVLPFTAEGSRLDSLLAAFAMSMFRRIV